MRLRLKIKRGAKGDPVSKNSNNNNNNNNIFGYGHLTLFLEETVLDALIVRTKTTKSNFLGLSTGCST